MVCRKKAKLHGGPTFLTGRVVSDNERGLESSNIERCYRLWTVLYGAGCDFDDCLLELAKVLGWQEPGEDIGLFEVLDAAVEYIYNTGQAWSSLRQLAIDAFMTCRQTESVETSSYDGRTWDQAVDDALFSEGSCKACSIGYPGGPRAHRGVAGVVLRGRVSWSKLQDLLSHRS